TPDRTTLIASTHRTLAVSEKTVPGDGISSSDEVKAAAEIATDRLIMLDLDRVAAENGSVISSALFGALAGSGALPFPRSAFEAAIQDSKKSVETSLLAFGAAYERAQLVDADPVAARTPSSGAMTLKGPDKLIKVGQALIDRIENLPAPAQQMAQLGLRKVVQFQDVNYGIEYLDHLDLLVALDQDNADYTLSVEAAKYIANAMAYDDIIRVADLKTQRERFERISAEMGAENSPIELTEFFHPRAEEIAGMLPANLGTKVEQQPHWMARLNRWFSGSRRIRTHRLGSFLTLYLLGGLRGYRRRTLRHKHEQDHLIHWLAVCRQAAVTDYDLAVELLRSRRLIKGYSDTHARSLSKFDKVLLGATLVQGRQDAAKWVARLREAALQDEKGDALDGAIQTLKSFSNDSVDA
ncbi:MAG: indolepyruvate oxidoreductase subunit beta family protein, partial [Paracoccaceae bacterium]|nr:indolepyruvate oxidoreductase subunit beta family protein [Paracoccaceae bacterium]